MNQKRINKINEIVRVATLYGQIWKALRSSKFQACPDSHDIRCCDACHFDSEVYDFIETNAEDGTRMNRKQAIEELSDIYENIILQQDVS